MLLDLIRARATLKQYQCQQTERVGMHMVLGHKRRFREVITVLFGTFRGYRWSGKQVQSQ
jgi:hypothetical protein